MSVTLKRALSLLTAFFVIVASLLIFQPVEASAGNVTKYKVTYASDSVKVTLTAANSSNTIYYTTNGKKPTTSSKVYKSRLSAKKAYTLRVIEVDKKGKTVSTLKLKVTPKVAQPKMYIVGKALDHIRISDATSGAVIRYTTDGSQPNESSAVYTGPIPITEGSVVTARAYKDGWKVSDTFSYKHSTKSKSTDFVEGVLELVNEQRADAGLSPLKLDEKLCKAAQARVKELNRKFEHTRPDGTLCFTAFDEAGASYRSAAENIAKGQRTPEAVMSSWLKSEGHKQNILGSKFKKTGIAYVIVDNYYYWVELFTD